MGFDLVSCATFTYMEKISHRTVNEQMLMPSYHLHKIMPTANSKAQEHCICIAVNPLMYI